MSESKREVLQKEVPKSYAAYLEMLKADSEKVGVIMTEIEKAYKAYEAEFDESPPLMFLRGLSFDEQSRSNQ